MKPIPESELILNSNNRVYHLDLNGDHVADDVIVVGDPERVNKISSRFSKIEFTTEHREFMTHTGDYQGKQLTVISTGIGTDNIDIVLNELDAAVNIDLNNRIEKEKKRALNIYRLGTSGALQEYIPVNSLVLSAVGLGLDGLLHFYKDGSAVNQSNLSQAFSDYMSWPPELAAPYAVACDSGLLNRFSKLAHHTGITATAPGFYGPQGRAIRLPNHNPNLEMQLASFRFEELKITNFEMETSALYGLGKMLGHRCLTLCVVIANRTRKEFTKDTNASEQLLIDTFLNHIL